MELYFPLEQKMLEGISARHAYLDENTVDPEVPYANELLVS